MDSEPLANQVLAAFLSELGFPHTTAQCSANYGGMSIPSLIAKVELETGKTLPKDFHDELWRRDQIAFADRLQPIPGVAEILAQLDGPRCVASSSAPVRIINSLKTTGLIEFFEPYLYSAAQVANGKPAPDLFLFAAAEMGVVADECVVIEDSVPGVQAGKAAGMRVLGFSGGGHCRPGHNRRLTDAGADVAFSDMVRLTDFI